MAAIKYSIGPINPNVSREFFVIVRLAMLIVLAPRSIDIIRSGISTRVIHNFFKQFLASGPKLRLLQLYPAWLGSRQNWPIGCARLLHFV